MKHLRYLPIILIAYILVGCISMSMATGSSAQVESQIQEAIKQATESKTHTQLELNQTIVDITPTADGKYIVHMVSGGGLASSGNTQVQQSDTNQSAYAKASAVAEATGKLVDTVKMWLYIIIGALVLLIIFSVGSRTVWPWLKKWILSSSKIL
jgi:PBP1b-binding outer membrane lipoprotein LpoB